MNVERGVQLGELELSENAVGSVDLALIFRAPGNSSRSLPRVGLLCGAGSMRPRRDLAANAS